MKAAGNTALQNFLAANRAFPVAHLFTLTLAGGTTLLYTDWASALTINTKTYLAGASLWKYKSRSEAVGVAVATCTVEVYPSPSDLILGSTFLQAAVAGQFDGGRLQVERCIPTQPSLGSVILFNGRISDIDPGRSMMTISVKADLEWLNIQIPRNLYQPGCQHNLFDGGCALSPASFAVATTVVAGSTQSVLQLSLPEATGYFDLGRLTYQSGPNNGLQRMIKSWVAGSPGQLTLLYGLPTAPAAGDNVTLYPGCDRQQSTCSGKFNNLVHFRGMPYVPKAENAYY